MNKLLTLLIVCAAFFANAQTELEQAKANLAAAEVKLAEQQANVDAAAANVATLTPPVIWKKKQSLGVSLSSLGLINWVAGGVNSNAVSAFGNISRNYKKDNISWDNNLDLAYGLIQNAGEEIRKNDDRIDLLSKFGVGLSPKLSYSSLVNFRSQFAPGFNFAEDADSAGNRPVISRFLAPATIVASTGFDYKLTDFLSIYLSPATGKFTIVNDDDIAAQRTYIPNDLDENGDPFYNANFRPEFGAFFKATLDKDLTKKINIKSTLDLFNNLTDANKENRRNTDVDWIVDLNMQLTSFLNARIFTYTKYDHNQVLAAEAALGNGPAVQLQTMLGIGFNYKF